MNNEWNKLDNAANIFPAAQSKKDTQVFRFACELYKDIDKNLLQRATEDTLEEFKIFRSILRRGLFWYYLEDSDLRPVVREEYKSPCAPIYQKNNHRLLFEVTYYKNRINLEVFHVLTDGTGAMNFLKTLAAKYLSLAEGIDETVDYDASGTQKSDDSFSKYYSGRINSKQERNKTAYKITGRRLPDNRLKVITGTVSAGQTLEKAHEYGVTLTAFVAAAMVKAVIEEMPVRLKGRRPVTILVPVNLRNFFPSVSARNFFCLTHIKYDIEKHGEEFKDIVSEMNAQLRAKLTKENLLGSIDVYSAVERNLITRVVPLALKDFFLRIAYRMSGRAVTATLSNIGIVKMPPGFKKYIKCFGVFISTDRLQLCSCSYEDKLTLGFTSLFEGSDIEMRFFRMLSEMGIDVEIGSNVEEDKNETLQ